MALVKATPFDVRNYRVDLTDQPRRAACGPAGAMDLSRVPAR